MTEEHEHEHKHKREINKWKIFSMVLIIILAVSFLIIGVNGMPASNCQSKYLTKDEAGNKAVKFINENLVQPNTTATVISVVESNDMYNVSISYLERTIPVYITKDGTNLFLSSPIDITQPIPKPEEAQQQPTETPKTDKPVVQLFVMAFCPYGIQAENVMKPVVDLLGTKADIKVHFITSVSGTTPDSVSSLHGAPEAQEDLRQACIMKYYDQTTFWNYLMKINVNCSSKYSNTTAYDTCWKDAAKQSSIDTSKIDTCSKGSDGVSLIKADADLSSSKGVSGSPTLLINGVTYNGARDSNSFKEVICNAFTTAPSECSTALSSTTTASSGGC